MSRLNCRPSRTQSQRIVSSVSIALFAFLALICLYSPVVKAEETHAEYGTVIGIGTCQSRPVVPPNTHAHFAQISEQRTLTFIHFLSVATD